MKRRQKNIWEMTQAELKKNSNPGHQAEIEPPHN